MWLGHLLCPRHDNGRGIKCYPCPFVRTYVTLKDVRSLSWIFFIGILWKLVLLFSTIKYFLKFDNGPYRTMASGVMALWLWKYTILNNVHSLSWIHLTRILWNLVTLLSTMMFSSSLIMVYITPCFQELWLFVYVKSPFEMMSAL